ncbi:UDP-glucose 4-epimerase family protein [Shewanella mangrovisoli]|uniref:UDP-glucose 4-epimerase family protein n=1 Tax=Shewanella mangrovisoli TaxID=2864211 RepID=UPI0035BA4117
MNTHNIFLTGGTGFIGEAVLARLQKENVKVAAAVRTPNYSWPSEVQTLIIDDVIKLPKALETISNIDTVIHIAAKAHIAGVPLSEFRRVNTDATLNLAKTAAANGVKRFIFLSSIGVNGISSTKPFNVDDKPAPVEDYAISKLEAEAGLKQIASDSGLEVVIIRPPLVYGAHAPGNFGKLARLAQKKLPLPLGAIHNKRSLVALDNLVDLIVTCIDHPKAANQTFFVSDDMDVSTTELLRTMTIAVDKAPWLVPVPIHWLKLIAKLIGKQAMLDRLCGNLQVDISHTKHTLNWKPPISFAEGIKRCFNKDCK